MCLRGTKFDCRIAFELRLHHCTHCFTRLSPSLPLFLPWFHFFCQLHLPLVPLVRGQAELCMVKELSRSKASVRAFITSYKPLIWFSSTTRLLDNCYSLVAIFSDGQGGIPCLTAHSCAPRPTKKLSKKNSKGFTFKNK